MLILLVRGDKPAVVCGMGVPHGEGLATHAGLESCAAVGTMTAVAGFWSCVYWHFIFTSTRGSVWQDYREFLHADRTIGPVLGKGEEREESDSCCIRAWLSAQRDRRASGVHYATV